MTEKRALQFAVLLAGCVPVSAGLSGVLLGPVWLLPVPPDAMLDSHFRYLSGLLLGLGLAFWAMVPRIETNGAAVRLMTLVIVAGGLGRLFGAIAGPAPGPVMSWALVMELIVTPALCLWQWRVARRERDGETSRLDRPAVSNAVMPEPRIR